MRLHKKLALALFAVLTYSVVALAAERYTLQYYEQEFNGPNQVIQLKQDLRRQFANLTVRDAELLGVEVVAKSQYGNGMISLVSDGRVLSTVRVAGSPMNYDRMGIRTYNRINMGTLSQYAGNTWQLRLSGNIKVHSVSVFLEDSYGNVPPRFRDFSFSYVGQLKADKLIASTETLNFAPRRADLVLIRVVEGELMIDEARATYANGQVVSLPQLAGRYYSREQAVAYVPRPGYLVSISVRARSRNILGSRSEFQVMIGERYQR